MTPEDRRKYTRQRITALEADECRARSAFRIARNLVDAHTSHAGKHLATLHAAQAEAHRLRMELTDAAR